MSMPSSIRSAVSTCVYELAEGAFRAMHHDYVIPKNGTWDDAPFLSSWRGVDALQAAIPLSIRTSIEGGKAAELVLGKGHKPDEGGRTRIPFADGKGPRPGAIIARAGIIAQFELWKAFVKPLGYPTNEHKAAKHTFSDAEEAELMFKLVDDRNRLTHEIATRTDPTMRGLVEFAYACIFLLFARPETGLRQEHRRASAWTRACADLRRHA